MPDDRLLRRLRVIGIGVVAGCLVLVVVSGIIGRFTLGTAFPPDDDVLTGTLVGALLVLAGVTVPSRFRLDVHQDDTEDSLLRREAKRRQIPHPDVEEP